MSVWHAEFPQFLIDHHRLCDALPMESSVQVSIYELYGHFALLSSFFYNLMVAKNPSLAMSEEAPGVVDYNPSVRSTLFKRWIVEQKAGASEEALKEYARRAELPPRGQGRGGWRGPRGGPPGSTRGSRYSPSQGTSTAGDFITWPEHRPLMIKKRKLW